METASDPRNDVSEIERATTDAATELANRAGFEIQARHALVICRRLRLPATLLFIEMERLTAIRESLGDAEADRTLAAFASALRKILRGSDILGHHGSGVFAALLIDCSEAATGYVLARLRAALAKAGDGPGYGYRLGFNTGCVEFLPERHSTLGQLFDDADAELYSQKHARD
jgi:diguanylate cyclase (GGDEF)-like protein